MFQSFTGSSRRPRQVNLSGRTTNPFAAFPGNSPSRQTPHASNPQSAVAIAQQERLQRQRDREKQNAVRVIQRVWRGSHSKKATYGQWRVEWDSNEHEMMLSSGLISDLASEDDFRFSSRRPAPYATADQCLAQLRLLVQFVSSRRHSDIRRLVYFADAFGQTFRTLPTIATEGEWTKLLKRLAIVILDVLASASARSVTNSEIDSLFHCVMLLTSLIPKQIAMIADTYYEAMAFLTTNMSSVRTSGKVETSSRKGTEIEPEVLQDGILALLRPITSETISAYEAFATSYLTIPNLEAYMGKLDKLASQINYRMLALAVSACLQPTASSHHALKNTEARTWLLSYLIFFHRHALGSHSHTRAPELDFVAVISELLTSTATYLVQGLDVDDPSDMDSSKNVHPLHPFIKEQVTSLVNQSSVTGLLSPIRSSSLPSTQSEISESDASKEAKVLATYALNLLRIFPRRGDDIRMWLYLGSAPSDEQAPGHPEAKIPAIKYFWQASRSSHVFQTISRDSTKVLPLLQPPQQAKEPIGITQEQRDQEWTTILLFLELYTFVLKVMDDDEFFSSMSTLSYPENSKVSWTRESALPLGDVKDMTIFLKNLAFTLYWNAVDLTEPELQPTAVNLSSYFSNSPNPDAAATLPTTSDLETKSQTNYLPGVTGIPLEYFKGLVTGLLRMLHERDSRRKFLPQDHWLMTTRFDMEGFISSVVAEEERRHEFQSQSDDADDTDIIDDDTSGRFNESSGLAGTSHAQQTIRRESLRRHQQRVARGRILAAIAPRLEILRNMPFFIPFATRVQIFREFIFHDQHRRRHGFVDPDLWRASVAQATMGQMINGHPAVQDVLARHQAEIRREHLFDDALSQFYPLGDGLKEPIQISFIDRFGSMEAGIDGGGVTKEFLTSVTSEAFNTESEFSMFAENDQHLLYPNPTAVDQCKERLRENGLSESDAEWTGNIRDMLRRYEFLGRVIGKCLYEGILVDVNFVPFFLLKWALTGGTGSAVKESSYRANLNDLKDLDQGLYQGLLQLKNYSGDVEDFTLDFTVTDTIPTSGSTHRTVTKELRPNGSDIPVTNQNRLVYISYIARYRLQVQPSLQTNAFLQGLGQIIQPAWLSMFNQSELQTLVSGETGDIDVEDLRRNTLYGGVYTIGDDNEEHPTVKIFWQVMHDMSIEERQKVLRFVTSTPRAPLLGFSHLHPRFSIRDSSSDEERLPSTSTCVNLLKLPRYSNAETLRSKLLYAVSSGAGFDLS
ncbi:hypothetical protein N7492_000943 [Penicillium capsulatum]|uniref:HECT-type E3 ubiquitin transferase n=1 Tax=Penicillium capsulatum TaxID=69766 RepID=A0A9W9ISV9_9EURO|nr:hypothetical protein N7492_000943 [Penicillium capsulatum]KAJ6130000.1 hypothetical protein N7512_002780 [Penicillium capsulatum]